jgi:L-ascorbate metabolism protein UlaG (beta-lactamase superfamily)
MRLRLIRHATLIVEFSGKRLLVDPMLSDVGAMPPVQNAPNQVNIPLVPLPIAASEVVQGIDAVLVTHTHRDHWDDAATKLVPKDHILFGQAADQMKFHEWGFHRFQTIYTNFSWEGIEIIRTGGQHGTGEIGKAMAPVAGFVLKNAGEPTLYIAGDTIWCREIEHAIATHKPDVIVVNAGAAQFNEGDPITMTADDVLRVCEAAPQAKIIAVHMETVNHCLLTRAMLRERAVGVVVPNDGDFV